MLALSSTITFDHRALAGITLFGMALDGLGSLYLPYDLLGGNRGPLRILARAVTYGLIFTCVYTPLLGFRFGLVVGIGMLLKAISNAALAVSCAQLIVRHGDRTWHRVQSALNHYTET
jgi:hypothetical protein